MNARAALRAAGSDVQIQNSKALWSAVRLSDSGFTSLPVGRPEAGDTRMNLELLDVYTGRCNSEMRPRCPRIPRLIVNAVPSKPAHRNAISRLAFRW